MNTDEIRARHVHVCGEHDCQCGRCKQSYPCDAIRSCDEVDRLTASLGVASGLVSHYRTQYENIRSLLMEQNGGPR